MLNLNFLAIHMPGFDEWIVIAIIGVIVFGKRLPEVGKNLGKGIVEFKKGLKGIEEEVNHTSSESTKPIVQNLPPPVVSVEAAEHKFDPATGQPLQAAVIPAGSKFDPYTGKPLEPEQVAAGGESKESGKWY